MKPVVLDKIGSVTMNCNLSREVRLTDEIRCREGDVLAVRVLTRKSTYNTIELPSGRFSMISPGDIVAGALGHRRALGGYAGHIPEKLAVGDKINILNLGGVLGICDSAHPDLGNPFEVEVLGAVLHFPYLGERIGVPANITQGAPPFVKKLDVGKVPVVAVVGTCMNAGKTFACTTLVQEFARRRLVVHAAKATGVSLRKDILAMEDAGADKTMIFTDLGVVTTQAKNAPDLSRTMLTMLAEEEPDIIVLELGDGLLGDYGVDAILADAEIRASFSAIVLAANDPVGAWGGLRRLREEYGLETTVVTGPTTDNVAGTDVIQNRMGVPAANARMSGARLGEIVLEKLGLREPPAEAVARG